MTCLKCGRDTADDHVFCQECLAVMDRYPVKPGTPVHLPHPAEPAPVKKSRKRVLSPDEQIFHLRRQVRRLMLGLSIVTVLLALCAGLLAYKMLQQQMQPVSNYGRNYTIDTSHNT